MNNLLRVFSWVRRYPWLAAGTLTCAILSVLCGVLVYPQAVRHILDEAIPNQQPDRLAFWALAALAAYFARDLLNAARIVLNNVFEQKVIFDLRSDLYARLQRLPLPWFDHRPTGDIMTTVSEDVTAVERVLIDGIEQGVAALLQVVVVAGVLLWTNAALGGWALAPLPLLAVGALIYTNISRQRHRAVRKAASAMNSLLMDNLGGIRQIKAYTREDAEHTRFNGVSDTLRRATLRVMTAWATYQPSMAFVGALGFVLVLWFGGRAALAGELSPGELASVLFLLALLYEPIGRLHTLNQIFQSGRAAAERVFDILDTEEEEPPHDPKAHVIQPPVFGRIEYRGVNFAYTERTKTLQDVSLQARPGETVALVGATGAGKSTIINLLCRFYELPATGGGDILLDGHSIRDITKASLRGAIGYVTQESFLFNGTVKDNLLIARPQATEAELWAALEAANARAFVERLPERLATEVGERGVRLSVGEKQRLSIARALLKNPPILLLDEATASVDTETERQIQQALDRLMEGRTCFVIAHRLSTVRHADRIYVLDHGQVVQEGTHEALLAEPEGIYAELCRHSFLGEGAPAPAGEAAEPRIIERLPAAEQARLIALEAELADATAERVQAKQRDEAFVASEADRLALREETARLRQEIDTWRETAHAWETQHAEQQTLRQADHDAADALRRQLADAEAKPAPAASDAAQEEDEEVARLRRELAARDEETTRARQTRDALQAEVELLQARLTAAAAVAAPPAETPPSDTPTTEEAVARLQQQLEARDRQLAQAALEKKHAARLDRDLAASEAQRLKVQAELEELKTTHAELHSTLDAQGADHQAETDARQEELAQWQTRLTEQERLRVLLESELALVRAENERLAAVAPPPSAPPDPAAASHPELALPPSVPAKPMVVFTSRGG